MATFTEVRTARKDHIPYTRTGGCDVCLGPIEKGQTYVRSSSTPWDQSDIALDSEGWKHMKLHWPYGSCPEGDH
jgi:hypothetical protein